MLFDYEDFRDIRYTEFPVGEEPLYGFNATVVRAFISFFY
jgi:hypothetical protein